MIDANYANVYCTNSANERFTEVTSLKNHVKDRPLVEVKSFENSYFHFIAPSGIYYFVFIVVVSPLQLKM